MKGPFSTVCIGTLIIILEVIITCLIIDQTTRVLCCGQEQNQLLYFDPASGALCVCGFPSLLCCMWKKSTQSISPYRKKIDSCHYYSGAYSHCLIYQITRSFLVQNKRNKGFPILKRPINDIALYRRYDNWTRPAR